MYLCPREDRSGETYIPPISIIYLYNIMLDSSHCDPDKGQHVENSNATASARIYI